MPPAALTPVCKVSAQSKSKSTDGTFEGDRKREVGGCILSPKYGPLISQQRVRSELKSYSVDGEERGRLTIRNTVELC
ncbi:hypothetical protein OJAV_G00090850 [Oryzias javanicus]|uniref:Uncharacterized protein n=1 Tax=Oryzias javanicus TaxID=123683 RepID=A0A3S2MJC7_ORYJA|nr:hypothetical protein OJAV_G00090850 [Oryzias javanicus]